MRCQSAAQPSPSVHRLFAAQPSPDSLQKQEQISGPKNASIARFDGLGCYQVGSEKAPDFGTRAKRLPPFAANAGLQRLDGDNRLATNLAVRCAGGCGNPFAARRCAANPPRSLRHLFIACLLRNRRLIHCKNRSKFQAPKTPPSHGLTGLAAIKSGAKKRQISARGQSGCPRSQQTPACSVWMATTGSQQTLPCGARAAAETRSQPGDALPIRRAAFAICSSPVCCATVA